MEPGFELGDTGLFLVSQVPWPTMQTTFGTALWPRGEACSWSVFYQQAGLRIDEINVFGNKVSLDSPWWTAFSLRVLWGYFLVRFYQYFRIIPDKCFWNAYEQQMKR